MIHFPDDWIAPGEFRFCLDGYHMHGCCKNKRKDKLIKEVRIELATLRKDNGVPRLFWMQQ